jgi:pyridinium-3,5-bisthiocarboxylic acid mononucleotide nickel chelatase
LATICYLDAFSGLSGDMLTGALADAGADREAITAAIHSLDAGARVSFETTKRRDIGATKFRVVVEEAPKHRHLSGIVKMIAAAELPDRVKAMASAVFQRLAEAESAVHQQTIEKVHFHEVGAVDSIADIVGACLGFHLLGADTIVCSAVNVGSGTVNSEHGVLPVPAPATAKLLMGKPIYARGPAVELTTPTGAAVAAALASDFGAMPAMKIRAIGYGAGDKDFPEHANVLRVLVGEATGAREATTVCVIEANIDDSTPQVLGFAMERLMEAGALDATLQPLAMKKGRPGSLLRVIATAELREALCAIVFAETSTLGVRIYEAERRVQARHWVDAETAHGTIRIKAGSDGSYAPEYEDCRRIALATGRPLKEIIADANHAYLHRK